MVAEAELAYWGGAIVVSVLAAGGMALATGDAQKVGSAMYAALKDTGGKAWDSIQAMAAWAASAGGKVKDAAFRVGKDVWQAIADCFNKSYDNGYFSVMSNSLSVTRSNVESVLDSFNSSRQKVCAFTDADGSYWTVVLDVVSALGSNIVISKDSVVVHTWGFNDWENREKYLFFYYRGNGYLRVAWGFDQGSHLNVVGGFNDAGVFIPDGGAIVLHTSVSVPVDGDLKYPGDNYLVKAPDLPAVDTATGAVSWPSDAVYNKDAIALPYPIDAAGQKVADIPYDVPVDQTTGKTLDDADTGTDTDKPGTDTDKPGTDTGGLLGQIVALLKNFFDSPSDFRLNMDGFRNLVIKDKFPFCIPFDMVASVKQFAADAADYQFRIKLDTQFFSVDHVVDLTPLAVPLAFFRYIVVTWFVWVLLSRTRDLMKW